MIIFSNRPHILVNYHMTRWYLSYTDTKVLNLNIRLFWFPVNIHFARCSRSLLIA